jgi:hypothetical protein
MMKYEQTDKKFYLGRHIGVVIPFNAEKEKFYRDGKWKNDVSWSAGFTHYKGEDGNYKGFCGIYYFEKHAREMKKDV